MDLQTRSARQKRIEERRAVKELNNIGKRLAWVRTKVNLTQKEVSIATGIPCSSYGDRENGVRSEFYEEFTVLASYLNSMWQEKYSQSGLYPEYSGERLTKITQMFLMLGADDAEKSFERAKAELECKIFEIQRDSLKREEELRKQLDFFKVG